MRLHASSALLIAMLSAIPFSHGAADGSSIISGMDTSIVLVTFTGVSTSTQLTPWTSTIVDANGFTHTTTGTETIPPVTASTTESANRRTRTSKITASDLTTSSLGPIISTETDFITTTASICAAGEPSPCLTTLTTTKIVTLTTSIGFSTSLLTSTSCGAAGCSTLTDTETITVTTLVPESATTSTFLTTTMVTYAPTTSSDVSPIGTSSTFSTQSRDMPGSSTSSSDSISPPATSTGSSAIPTTSLTSTTTDSVSTSAESEFTSIGSSSSKAPSSSTLITSTISSDSASVSPTASSVSPVIITTATTSSESAATVKATTSELPKMTSICGTDYKYETVPNESPTITGYYGSAITIGTHIYSLTAGMPEFTVMVMKEADVTALGTAKPKQTTDAGNARKRRRGRFF